MDINIQRKIEKMKYLLKFNESTINDKITDRDFELIENCFLDFIDQDICTNKRSDDSVFFYFKMPNLKRKNTWPPHSPRMLWEWTYEFITQITGHIKRCESYGFVCYFHFFGQYPCMYYPAQQELGHITMSVHHKGSDIDEYLTIDSYVVEDALTHIQSKLVGLKENLSFERPRLNESNEPHEYENKGGESSKNFMITDRDFEIIENCFLDYVDTGKIEITNNNFFVSIDFIGDLYPFNIRLEDRPKFFLDLITRMSNDIKRCESYGYGLLFRFSISQDRKPHLIHYFHILIAHKRFWKSKKEVISDLMKKTFGEELTSKKIFNYQESLNYLTEIVNYSRKT